ncbi:MAG: hypothetical protein ABL949_04165 [Fimbriimonadaceae bacterium]
MVLKVAFDDFPASMVEYAVGSDAFLAELPAGCAVSAVNPQTGVIVSTVSDLDVVKARELLEASGLKVRVGAWTSEADDPIIGSGQTYVAAVAYRSRDFTPGLWMDAYPYEPSPSDVLREMYDEFLANGELKGGSFDEFTRLSFPNVVILKPEEISGYVAKKMGEE